MTFYPSVFPPIDTSQKYCVYLYNATTLRLYYDYRSNDNHYHAYMDYTIIGDSAIRSNVNYNAYSEPTEPYARTCLMDNDGTNILDQVLLRRDYVVTDVVFPILSFGIVIFILYFVYRLMFRRFIK